jgi:hypothetical protein
MVQALTITNTGGSTIAGPMYLVLDGLLNATLANATGTTAVAAPAGSPYISLPLGAGGALAPGQSVVVVLVFNDPQGLRIFYTPRVLAGSGTP